jgi:hypothetical protein
MKSKIILLLVILNIGCNSRNDKKVISDDNLTANSFYTINIPEILKSQREVPVSEIAEGIEYVILETSKESLLGRIFDVNVTKDFIFVQHHNGALAQFDRTGSFIRYIGRLGRGPEEYIMIGHSVLTKSVAEYIFSLIITGLYKFIPLMVSIWNLSILMKILDLLSGADIACLCVLRNQQEVLKNMFLQRETVKEKSFRLSVTIFSGKTIMQ